MIYLASPYNHVDPDVMRARYQAAISCAAWHYKKVCPIYSPIVHNHPIAVAHELPRDWAYWEKMDLPMLKLCEYLYVLMIDGWESSNGVKEEIKYALAHGIEVEFLTPVGGDDYKHVPAPFPYNELIKNNVRLNRASQG